MIFTFSPHPAHGNSIFMVIHGGVELFTIGAMSARPASRRSLPHPTP